MNRLYLIRHGENRANITLEFSSRKVDYPLTPKGILQARQTAEFFRGKQIDEIYSSPLKRAVETAEIIGEKIGVPVVVMENFREIDVGDLEGQKPTAALWEQHNAILAAWVNGHPDICFPNGEDYPRLLGRFKAGLMDILPGKTGKGIIIVGHGGIFTLTLRDYCEGVERTIYEMMMPNCGITEILAQAVDGRIEAKLLSYASAAHLSGDAAQQQLNLPSLEP